jgi:hypothetical protein
MPDQPTLGPRARNAYSRLARELGALNYVLRHAKPSGLIGETSRRSLNQAIRTANRLFRREPATPRFFAPDPKDPMTLADLTLLVARITASALAFEERYAHLTEDGIAAAAKSRELQEILARD